MAPRGISFPAPFVIGADAAPAVPSAYDEKRAELVRVVETLLLLPPRLAHAPPFPSEYEALAVRRRTLEAEIAAIERDGR